MTATKPRGPGRVKTLRADDEIAEVLRFLDCTEVARKLGVTPQTVRRWVRERPGFPQPRRRDGKAALFCEYDVDRWVADQRIGARAIPRGWL